MRQTNSFQNFYFWHAKHIYHKLRDNQFLKKYIFSSASSLRGTFNTNLQYQQHTSVFNKQQCLLENVLSIMSSKENITCYASKSTDNAIKHIYLLTLKSLQTLSSQGALLVYTYMTRKQPVPVNISCKEILMYTFELEGKFDTISITLTL